MNHFTEFFDMTEKRIIYPTKKNACSRIFFCFFFWSQIKYSTISFIQFSSSIINQLKPENTFNSVKIGVSNQSLNKEGVKTKCHKCFNMKYGHHPPQISCTSLTTLLV